MKTRIVILGLSLALPAITQDSNAVPWPAQASHLGATSRIAFSQTMPQLDGSHLQITTVEVTYAPGNYSAPHSHPCPVVGYVIHGAVRMQVKGGPETVYKAGDSFYEAPNGIHLVSANASSTEPATFLAYFLCDHSTALSVEMPESKAKGASQP
jgi:quercetin dioxygenase-like cupin family protein